MSCVIVLAAAQQPDANARWWHGWTRTDKTTAARCVHCVWIPLIGVPFCVYGLVYVLCLCSSSASSCQQVHAAARVDVYGQHCSGELYSVDRGISQEFVATGYGCQGIS
jgi:hypothetical protein